MKILCKTSYKGTNYKGWQKQVNDNSIQEEIEKSLSRIISRNIAIYGSGRTDSGVHAKGQTFHFEIEEKELSKFNSSLEKLRYSLNCVLPDDIHINEINEVNNDFHARYSVREKIYSYHINFGEYDVFNGDYELNYRSDLDICLLEVALKKFVGEHNFKNFTSKEEDEDNFVRTIYDISLKYDKLTKKAVITFKGDGFMRYMIRLIVGTSLAVASNKEDLSYIESNLIQESERNVTSYKAQGKGLILEDVIY